MTNSPAETLGNWALRTLGKDPFGLQMHVGRAILALGTFLTLVCNPVSILFHSGSPSVTHTVKCSDIGGAGLFCVFGSDSLDLARLCAALLCLPAILGIIPAVSGWLHAYAAFSLSSNAIGIEGGDQLTVNLALLLAAASILDRRWFAFLERRLARPRVRFIFSNLLLWTCAVQVIYVYIEAAVVKLDHPIWAEGTALWYWVQNSGFGVSREGEAFLLDLLAVPAVSAAATWGTMILELVLAGLLILGWRSRKARFIAIALGITFHVAIALLMGLITFLIAMTGALVLSCWRARDGYPLWLFRRLRGQTPTLRRQGTREEEARHAY